MLEGVEMGSMNGGAVLGWRGEEGAPRDAQCFSELSKELDLSSLGEATHLDSFAPATLVYAHLISKDWFFFFFFPTKDLCYSCNEIKQSLPVQEPINILELSPSICFWKAIQADLGGIHVSFKIHATS